MSPDIKTSVIDLSSTEFWSWASTHPDYSIFHTREWGLTLQKSYGYKPEYLLIERKGGGTAFLPIMEIASFLTGKRHISLPYSDYCPPIVNGEYPVGELAKDLLSIGANRGWNSLELRLGDGNVSFDGRHCAEYFHHVLDLSVGEEQIFRDMRDSTRRNIKKSQREGLEVSVSTSMADLRDYYHLNCLTRRRHGLPPQPFQFFLCLHEQLLERGQGIIVLARYRRTITAGAIFLQTGTKAYYKFGASEKLFQHLRPNNMVLWEGIRWYVRNGCRSLCFGRNEENNEGLRRYKLGWGAGESSINYYKYDFRKNLFVDRVNLASGIHTKVFRHAPLFLLRMIGSKIYRHMA